MYVVVQERCAADFDAFKLKKSVGHGLKRISPTRLLSPKSRAILQLILSCS